jgi:Leucine-rich repeat (LRR) protein
LNDEDLMKLADLESVRFLDVALNKITKVPIMKNVESLRELYLNYNYITDLSGFADNESFPALKSVYLGSNKITDAEALRKREGLSRLSIGNNCIQDLSPLEELEERGTYVGGMHEQLESCDDTSE